MAGNGVVAGLSTERLARIDEHLEQKYIEPREVAGALTLVARHGEVVHHSPVGMMDIEREKPMQQDTIFRIYSMTKPITSIALMTLYEQGRLQLNDPVHHFIPEWRNLGVFASGTYPNYMTTPVERPMTVRDLMSHQSGLTYGFMNRTNVDAGYVKAGIGSAQLDGGRPREYTLADMVKDLAEIPLEFSPGTAWNYSVSTDILGHLIEVISGQRFDDFLRERIFEPLGMVDSGFSVAEENVDRFAANYNRGPDGKLALADDPADSAYLKPPTLLSGGGGLTATSEDYWRFCQMLLNGGEFNGERIVGPKTIELMTMNHLPDGQDLSAVAKGSFSETNNDGVGFGLGFAVVKDVARTQVSGSVGSYYWGGAASTAFWVDPEEDLTVVFMTQFMPSGTQPFRGELRQLVYSSIVD
jgi:CubicO group peptidase (beta-lactamase class C family)